MIKSNNKKIPLWLPYTSKIEANKKKVRFEYKGGEYTDEIQNIHSIMLYGSSCELNEDFFQLANNGLFVFNMI